MQRVSADRQQEAAAFQLPAWGLWKSSQAVLGGSSGMKCAPWTTVMLDVPLVSVLMLTFLLL